MGTAHVASIHWFPVKVDRRQFGFGVYEMPAVALGGKPFILTVTDKVQTEEGPYLESQNRKQRSKKRFPETGQVIARDIVNASTTLGSGMVHGCHPGIWVVRESMPVLWDKDNIDEGGRVINPKGSIQMDAEGTAIWREATAEEKAAMWAEDLAENVAADAAYAERLVELANAEDERRWPYLSAVTKAAAKQYNITTGWNTKAGALERVQCPHCKEMVIKGAIRCKHCSEVIDAVGAATLAARQENEILRAGKSKAA